MEEVQDSKRNKKIDIFSDLLFLIFSIVTWIFCSSSFYILFLAFFTSLIAFSMLLNPFREYIIIKHILKFIGWVLGIIYILVPVGSSTASSPMTPAR